MSRTALILALAAGIFLAGCDEDDVDRDRPDTFRVEITVTDPDGHPVEGLQFGVAPDLPEFYQDGANHPPAGAEAPGSRVDDELGLPHPSPTWPVVAFEYVLAEAGDVRVEVEDVEGELVAVLHDEPGLAGAYSVTWNGKDSSGEISPGGVYYIHLVVRSGGEIRYEQAEPLLLAPLYPDQSLVGTTNARGELTITDRRLFPHLYGVTALAATDETGTVTGTMHLGPTMRFTVVDPSSGASARFDRDVEGPVALELVWDPEPAFR